jgi:hypothetical protein
MLNSSCLVNITLILAKRIIIIKKFFNLDGDDEVFLLLASSLTSVVNVIKLFFSFVTCSADNKLL